jgi:Tfp pilus assembly protein PilO
MTEQSGYSTVLDNAKKLKQTQTDLNNKSNQISAEQRLKLEKIIPDNPNNVPLILDLSTVAQGYGIKFQSIKTEEQKPDVNPQKKTETLPADIGVLRVDIVMTGSYAGITEFVRTIEKSLRIIDITGLSFSAGEDKPTITATLSFRTYWLR